MVASSLRVCHAEMDDGTFRRVTLRDLGEVFTGTMGTEWVLDGDAPIVSYTSKAMPLNRRYDRDVCVLQERYPEIALLNLGPVPGWWRRFWRLGAMTGARSRIGRYWWGGGYIRDSAGAEIPLARRRR